jgi:hypothetical protein
MEWIKATERLPPHAQVVLGWGYRKDYEGEDGLYLCGLDAEFGWREWPGLEDLSIFYWMEIMGPDNQIETLYIMND